MPETLEPVTRNRRRRWLAGVAVAMIVAVTASVAGLYLYADRLIERRLRPATIELLERRFESEVELEKLSVGFAPALSIRGEGLTLRHHGRRDISPIVTIRAFTIAADVRELWSSRIDRVHLEGLDIVIPPRRGADLPSLDAETEGASDGKPDVFIRELLAEDSTLTITSKREGKQPRVFRIRRLRFEDFEFSRPTPFEAALSNPTPEGQITAVGKFGPWNAEEPSLTQVEGSFLFNADLGTIKGIGGALHAEGTFNGPLEYIKTSGQTHTDGFHLSIGGAKFPLDVTYDAIVDGTNGDTRLQNVRGKLADSTILARGEIVRVPGVNGRRITLDTTAQAGRLEDFIKLTTRVPTSPITGLVDVSAKLDIPPGEPEVIERLRLDGTFHVASARFTTAIQERVDELSRRGQGRPGDEKIDNVASDFRGSFLLQNARMTLRSLRFRVRGAEVRLAGTYDIEGERLNFHGTLRLQARASRTQTGWRSILLRLFDPLLDGEGAGTVLPITITGTRDNPKFGVELKKTLFPRP
jgi:hypothetical protein